jgi:flagellar biosynthesis GTPase FlhF
VKWCWYSFWWHSKLLTLSALASVKSRNREKREREKKKKEKKRKENLEREREKERTWRETERDTQTDRETHRQRERQIQRERKDKERRTSICASRWKHKVGERQKEGRKIEFIFWKEKPKLLVNSSVKGFSNQLIGKTLFLCCWMNPKEKIKRCL